MTTHNLTCYLRFEELAQYVERAQVDLQVVTEAKDFGMYAHGTVDACFWLSLAAALTRSSWAVTAQHQDSFPGFQFACDAGIPDDTKDIRYSEVATFAVLLRHHMCFGDRAAMLKSYIRDSIYQAFAALGVGGPPRTLQCYKCWVAKLASNEFADELVVLATAMELNVRIVCVCVCVCVCVRPTHHLKGRPGRYRDIRPRVSM